MRTLLFYIRLYYVDIAYYYIERFSVYFCHMLVYYVCVVYIILYMYTKNMVPYYILYVGI